MTIVLQTEQTLHNSNGASALLKAILGSCGIQARNMSDKTSTGRSIQVQINEMRIDISTHQKS